ncbi:MAG: HEAT repeat domain-containing protein [Candidatus Polarisedimenticolia bacterium]
MRPVLLAAFLATFPAGAAVEPGQPLMDGGTIERRAMSGSISEQVRGLARQAGGPFWIGYAAAMIEGERMMCCWDSFKDIEKGKCEGCDLERDKGVSINSDDSRSGRLEGNGTFMVLARVKEGEIQKVRALSMDCALDTGRLTLYWLSPVSEQESLRWLASIVKEDSRHNGPGEEAVMAIALHRGDEAGRLMASYLEKGQPSHVREQAAFWTGNTRGRAGYEALKAALRGDDSEEFRKKVIFALSQNDTPEATDELVRVARTDDDSEVRGEALFWLAQKAGEKAAGALEEAIENDPDTDVKKKAVFALTQMPDEEGVPKLLELARKHRNPAVRKEAIFWLGQSGDPRALAFFEEILAD